MRNDVYRKAVPRYFIDGQADTVDRNGTLFHQKSGMFSRQGEAQLVIAGAVFGTGQGSGTIDVAADYMPAQPVSDSEGSFQVDPVAALEFSDGCAGNAFRRNIEGQGMAAPGGYG